MRKITLFIALLLNGLIINAQTVIDGIKYSIIGENSVEVVGSTLTGEVSVVIPSHVTIMGKKYVVEAIGEEAFYEYVYNDKLKVS